MCTNRDVSECRVRLFGGIHAITPDPRTGRVGTDTDVADGDEGGILQVVVGVVSITDRRVAGTVEGKRGGIAITSNAINSSSSPD